MRYIMWGWIVNTIAIILGLMNASYFDHSVFIFILNWIIIGTGFGFIIFGVRLEMRKNVQSK